MGLVFRYKLAGGLVPIHLWLGNPQGGKPSFKAADMSLPLIGNPSNEPYGFKYAIAKAKAAIGNGQHGLIRRKEGAVEAGDGLLVHGLALARILRHDTTKLEGFL